VREQNDIVTQVPETYPLTGGNEEWNLSLKKMFLVMKRNKSKEHDTRQK